MCARLALLLPAALAIFAARAAQADERPVLVIDATHGGGAALAERLTRALGPDPALRPGNAEVVAGLAGPTPVDDRAVTTATTTLATARERLVRFAHGDAATLARAAQEGVAGDADRPAVRELLADLAFVEAMAIAGDSGLAAAAPTFGLVHRLSPGRKLDPARYLPEVIHAFDAAATSAGPTGMLIIAAPGASEILVDGVAIGAEPVATTVAAGPHIVTARGEPIKGTGRRVLAAAGQTVRVDLISVVAPLGVRAARARDRLLAATSEVARIDAITTLLQLAGATDAIVLVDGSGTEIASRLYTERGGLGPARPVGDDVQAVLRPLRPLPRIKPPPDPPPVIVKPLPPALPWYQERWAKVSLGVGATAVVVGVVTAILLRDPGSSTLMPTIEVE